MRPARVPLLARAGQGLFRFFLRPDCPLSVVEVRSSSLGYARFARQRGELLLQAATALELPEGALRPSLVGQNLVDRELVGRTLEKLLERLGPPKKGRLALVLPDPVARLRILPPEEVPAGRRRESEELIRFRLRKGLPFDVREARIAFGASGPGRAAPLLVAVMSSRVLSEYESLFESLGLHAGIVDLSGMALLGAVSRPASGSGDWLLVNWEEAYVSFLLVRGGRLSLARTLDGPGAASPRHVATEVASTVLYYRNRLGGQGLERAVVRCSAGPAAERLALLEEPLGRAAESLDLGGVLPARVGEVELHRTLSGGAACLLGRAA